MLNRDPVSDGLQVWRNPRIISSFNQVIEARLELLDDPWEDVKETFSGCV